ncbi:MAG: hypothetical protein L3J39_12425 [Verrucomicrobiales bacterium]|nr:hypothetical protein [Verrucomicrobiales bacterium]
MIPSDLHAGVDTSVLMRLLTGLPEKQFELALDQMKETTSLGKRLLVSNLVVCEAYYACQHHYKMPKQDVLLGLHRLLSHPTFSVEDGLLDLLSQGGLASAKPGFIDRLIHLEYTKARTGLISFEKSAKKLPKTKIL